MYSKSIKEVVSLFQSDVDKGLSTTKAKEALVKYGPNELTKKKKTPLIVRFFQQFADVLILILLAAAAISLIVDINEWTDSLIILIVVILNAVLGLVQETKAEKSLEALEKMSAPVAKVVRDGDLVVIAANLVVPGDIVWVEAGDLVPADARIIECHNLKVDESALTGESVPVEKTNTVLKAENLPLGDRKNMVYSSTVVTYGRGKLIVTGSGMETEVGKIAGLLIKQKVENTPLQNQLAKVGKTLGIVSIAICAVVFIMEWATGLTVLDAFKTAVALAVAAVPEGLAAIVTLVLAIGVQKMVKNKAIIRKLPAVETLGCTSIVCSDKTGTLTQNKMTVMELYSYISHNSVKISPELNDEYKKILAFFAFASDGTKTLDENGEEIYVGDPTETAILVAHDDYGFGSKATFKRLYEFPFDSERKMMTVIGEYKGQIYSITKGAPDVVFKRCCNTENLTKIESANDQMSKKALRVLAVAYKKLDSAIEKPTIEEVENDFTLLGLVGMIDPPREEVKEAIMLAKKAGIRPIMITGDYISTACAIAEDLGILEEGQEAISGSDLVDMDPEEFANNIRKYSVYARVAPEHKVQIVEAWQKQGEIVAMTGDGVNDSPALKKADIGCAMGKVGTEVAKGASSMILVDDNFATIILAVKEGRGIYANIKKVIHFLLSSNIGEVLTIFVASIIGAFALGDTAIWGVPLLPVHLLFVNLITDTLPAFALGMEPVEETIMQQKPRLKSEGIFSKGFGQTLLWQGSLVGILTLISFAIGCNLSVGTTEASLAAGQTMAFITLSAAQLFHCFNVKSRTGSIFSKRLFDNKALWLAFFAGVGIMMLVVYVPFLADLFNLINLDLIHELIAFGLAFMMIVVVEIVKFFLRLKKEN